MRLEIIGLAVTIGALLLHEGSRHRAEELQPPFKADRLIQLLASRSTLAPNGDIGRWPASNLTDGVSRSLATRTALPSKDSLFNSSRDRLAARPGAEPQNGQENDPAAMDQQEFPPPPEGFARLADLEIFSFPRPLASPELALSTDFQQRQNFVPLLEPEFSAAERSNLRWKRLALVQTGSAGVAMYGFQQFEEYFGGVSQPFRVGNDWNKDYTLHFDELLHFQGSYRVTQGLVGLYRWCGISSPWAECAGAGTAATVMTFLEYLDGRRPKDQASYSDFAANFLGVGFALAKERVAALQDFDVQFSYRNPTDIFQRETLLKYDRMTHWLTYSLKRQWRLPFNVGLGYGIRNSFKSDVQSELYLGVGVTPVDILERYYPAAAKPLAWLGMYHLGWQVRIK